MTKPHSNTEVVLLTLLLFSIAFVAHRLWFTPKDHFDLYQVNEVQIYRGGFTGTTFLLNDSSTRYCSQFEPRCKNQLGKIVSCNESYCEVLEE